MHEQLADFAGGRGRAVTTDDPNVHEESRATCRAELTKGDGAIKHRDERARFRQPIALPQVEAALVARAKESLVDWRAACDEELGAFLGWGDAT